MPSYLSENQAEAEMLISHALAIRASGAGEKERTALGSAIQDFMVTNESWLSAAQPDAYDADGMYYGDQLDAAWAEVTGNQPGTWKSPNKYTTSAARPKDDSVSAQIFSSKFADDLREGIGPAFQGLGQGLMKGLGSTAVKVAAAGGVVLLIWAWIQKRGTK